MQDCPKISESKIKINFLKQESVIMVATIAFGMGIDKPDVRFIVHLDMPKSIEGYYQETGRAGRDGLEAEALMLYSMKDVALLWSMVNSSNANNNHKRLEQRKVSALLGLCETTDCRRRVLLDYFGEDMSKNKNYISDSSEQQDNNENNNKNTVKCNNCDNCFNQPQSFDGSQATKKSNICGLSHRTNIWSWSCN